MDDKIKALTERVKQGDVYVLDLDIGETAYVDALSIAVREYRGRRITAEELIKKQKELADKLERYYRHRAMFDRHIQINNRYSHILTEAEKSGCPICRKIVKILDGRE